MVRIILTPCWSSCKPGLGWSDRFPPCRRWVSAACGGIMPRSPRNILNDQLESRTNKTTSKSQSGHGNHRLQTRTRPGLLHVVPLHVTRRRKRSLCYKMWIKTKEFEERSNRSWKAGVTVKFRLNFLHKNQEIKRLQSPDAAGGNTAQRFEKLVLSLTCLQQWWETPFGSWVGNIVDFTIITTLFSVISFLLPFITNFCRSMTLSVKGIIND